MYIKTRRALSIGVLEHRYLWTKCWKGYHKLVEPQTLCSFIYKKIYKTDFLPPVFFRWCNNDAILKQKWCRKMIYYLKI